MSTVVLTCPTCSLGLSVAAIDPKSGTDVVTNGAVEGHIHMTVSGTVACLNGHTWTATGDFLLQRVS